jgi:hypothetical protein
MAIGQLANDDLPSSDLLEYRTQGHAGTHGHVDAQLSYQTCSWDTLYAGDCVQTVGVLRLNDDGSAHYHSVMYTNETHSGDYWWTGFFLQDGDKVTMAAIDYRKGPQMDDGDPPPRYDFDFDFNFDPSIWARIAFVTEFYKC